MLTDERIAELKGYVHEVRGMKRAPDGGLYHEYTSEEIDRIKAGATVAATPTSEGEVRLQIAEAEAKWDAEHSIPLMMSYDRSAEVYDASEQDVLARVFAQMLRACTVDGGRKRAAGLKVPWWRDPEHEAAIFSHLNAWYHGVVQDADSGAHPLVHLAFRALCIAYQETYGKRDPGVHRGYDKDGFAGI